MDNTITTAFTSGIASIKGDMISMITIAIPIILAIVGLVMAVKFGIKFFKGTAKGN